MALFLVHLLSFAFASRVEISSVCDAKGRPTSNFKCNDLTIMWGLAKTSESVFILLQNQILCALRGPSNKTVIDPRDRDEQKNQIRCQYHSHGEGYDCRREDECTEAGFLLDVSEKETCTVHKKLVVKYNKVARERIYDVSRVFSKSKKWKIKQGKINMDLETSQAR